ncbi:MAG: FKBP-type peptidyl-prolyl cis-trans isomerase [Bordetella sp.]|nr:MAG: FKBP-type peptidyl-prolyl cis-trans isomerase [Bordetella sp.]
MNNSYNRANNFVNENSYLTLHYRITSLSQPRKGFILVNTFNSSPTTFQMGTGQWSPGLEKTLLNRQEGENFTVELMPKDAYGEINPSLIQKISISNLRKFYGKEHQFSIGDHIELSIRNNFRCFGLLKDLDKTFAKIDFNHPLAGSILGLKIYILGIL